ncbi:MAG: MgtC/SapB family protein [Gillisia sp.]
MDLMEFGVRISLAALAGIFIGLEREFKGKDAGLKTNALVALGACVFVLLSLEFRGEEFVDTTRVIGQVVAGIGFIGAGTILQQRGKVEGLTSAATIWCSAAAGCLAAMGMFWELGMISALVLFINLIFNIIENKLIRNRKQKNEKRNLD